jgi:hypothetical protein
MSGKVVQMTVGSYLLDAYQDGKGRAPVSQSDFSGKTLVKTPYGFGVIDSVNPSLPVVKISMLAPDMRSINPSASVSLPWDRIEVLPDFIDFKQSVDSIRGTAKRESTDFDIEPHSVKRRTHSETLM